MTDVLLAAIAALLGIAILFLRRIDIGIDRVIQNDCYARESAYHLIHLCAVADRFAMEHRPSNIAINTNRQRAE